MPAKVGDKDEGPRWLELMHQSTRELYVLADCAAELALGAEILGQERLALKLRYIEKACARIPQQVSEAIGLVIDEDVRKADQHTANLLEAVLVGAIVRPGGQP